MWLPPECPPKQCASENCQCKVLKEMQAGEVSGGEIHGWRAPIAAGKACQVGTSRRGLKKHVFQC
jgi:hypothetical protein